MLLEQQVEEDGSPVLYVLRCQNSHFNRYALGTMEPVSSSHSYLDNKQLTVPRHISESEDIWPLLRRELEILNFTWYLVAQNPLIRSTIGSLEHVYRNPAVRFHGWPLTLRINRRL